MQKYVCTQHFISVQTSKWGMSGVMLGAFCLPTGSSLVYLL